MVLFGADDDRDRAPREMVAGRIKELFPIYPLTKGVDSWDLQRAVAFALTVVDDMPELAARRPCATSTTCSTSRTALRLDPRPRRLRPGRRGAATRFRFEEALVTQLVLARRRAAVRALGAQARAGRQGGLLAAFDAAAALRADRRASARSARRSRPTSPSRTR